MRPRFLVGFVAVALLLSASVASAAEKLAGAPPLPPPVHPTNIGRGNFAFRIFMGQGPNNETRRSANGFDNRTHSWTYGAFWVAKKPSADGTFKVRGIGRTGWYSETQKGGKVVQEATGSTTTVGSKTRSRWTTKDVASGEQHSYRTNRK